MKTLYQNDFPLLNGNEGASARSSQAKPLIYLDNAATTQKPTEVLEAVKLFYEKWNANPYRGLYRNSKIATELYESARAYVGEFIGAQRSEIVFTRNTTEAINLIAYSYGLQHLDKNDQVVVSILEHHSNLVVWQQICAMTGAELVYLYPDKQGVFGLEEIEQTITRRTKIVAITYVSNVLGSVNPAETIIEHAHSMGAVVMLDCAQIIAHRPVSMKKLDVDFAAFSGHKVYGPMGIGVLYCKEQVLRDMKPCMFGGEMIDEVFKDRSTFADGPKRFEAGTPNVGGALGLAQAFQYLEKIGFDAIQKHEQQLTKHLIEGLSSIDAVTIYGNSSYDENRCGVISFSVAGTIPDDVAAVCDQENIAIRSGSHCAQPLHQWLGIENSCRVSPCFYNSLEEIDVFLEVVASARRKITQRIMTFFP